MRLEVAFTPLELSAHERKVCVVIDVLRASSSAVAMFQRGLEELLVAGSVGEARSLAAKQRGYLLCGEEGGLAPEGFDFGNSPSEFAGLELRGRRAVMATSNGTGALVMAAACPVVLLGALLNAQAVAEAALAEAKARALDVALVCAGTAGGRLFSLEDTFCAGALVEALLVLEPAIRPWSSATAARRLYRSYRRSARRAFREADHAAGLVALGFADDLAFCARRDWSKLAPRLEAGAGLLRIVGG